MLRETIIFLKVEKLIQISVNSLKTHLNSKANLCLCTFDQFKVCQYLDKHIKVGIMLEKS